MQHEEEFIKNIVENHAKYKVKRSADGFDIVLYEPAYWCNIIFYWKEKSRIHIDLLRIFRMVSLNFRGDQDINYEAYQEYAWGGFKENMTDSPMDLMHAIVGMSGELGEVLEVIKKHVFHGKELDKLDLTIELGDFKWYEAVFLKLMKITMSDTMKANKTKLDSRYKDGRRDLVFRDAKLEYKKVKETLKA